MGSTIDLTVIFRPKWRREEGGGGLEGYVPNEHPLSIGRFLISCTLARGTVEEVEAYSGDARTVNVFLRRFY